jgi:hypothetical protein
MAVHQTLVTLFRELVDGPAADAAWMLNGDDEGLLRSLDKLSAPAASRIAPGRGASIAAHVDHLRYGLSLMNRWSRGEADPWTTADWTASWSRSHVEEQEWGQRREELAAEVRAWMQALKSPREYSPFELNGVIASIAHLAYHMGAIRQIDRSIRGPAAT